MRLVVRLALWEMPPSNLTTPASLASAAGLEFRAHGKPDLAAPLFQRALDWYQARPASERARFAVGFSDALFDAGRYAEALVIKDSLSRAQPENAARLGLFGLTALMRGDSATVRSVESRLAGLTDKYLRGLNTVYLSRIAAQRGECSRASELLRQALSQGQVYSNYAHHYWASLGKARDCAGLRRWRRGGRAGYFKPLQRCSNSGTSSIVSGGMP